MWPKTRAIKEMVLDGMNYLYINFRVGSANGRSASCIALRVIASVISGSDLSEPSSSQIRVFVWEF